MATNKKQTGIVGKLESTAGTRVEPQAADSNVILMGEPTITLDFGNESAGKLADGSFNDGPVVGGMQKMTIGDFFFHLLGSGTDTVSPVSWKYLQMAGATIGTTPTTLEKFALWDGVPDCTSMSMDVQTIGCDKKGKLYKGRGVRGNCSISWSGSNAPVVVTITGATGAFVSETEVATLTPYEVTGADAYTGLQKASNFAIDFGGTVYAVNAFTFTTEFEITYEIANNGSGIATAKLTGQSKKLSMSVLQLSVGDDMIAKAKDNELFDVTLTGTNGMDIIASDCQITGTPTFDDIEGMNAWTVDMQLKSFKLLQK